MKPEHYNIITLEETESTNAYALEFMSFLDDKTVIRAEKQTAGRGRYNRKWLSDGSDNLYTTFVLKPAGIENYPFSNLTQYLSVIVSEVLEKDYDINASIKWPNDILVNGAKISGILAETSIKNNEIEGIALGLGLNVSMPVSMLNKIDQKAASMAVLKNKNFDTEEVLNKICSLFFENYDEFIKKGFSYIKDDYIKRCSFLGGKITIREESREYTALSIDDEGLLIVEDDFNNTKKIMTGDILC